MGRHSSSSEDDASSSASTSESYSSSSSDDSSSSTSSSASASASAAAAGTMSREDALAELEKMRKRTRLRWTDWLVDRPCTVMCAVMIVAVFLALGGLGALFTDIANEVDFPAQDATGVRDDIRQEKFDGLRKAREDIEADLAEAEEEPPSLQSVAQWIVYVIYLVPEATGEGSIWSQSRLNRMRDIEDLFTKDDESDRFCQLVDNAIIDPATGAFVADGTRCSAPFSPVPHLFPEVRDVDIPLAPAVPLTPAMNASLCPPNFTIPLPYGPGGSLVNTPACPYPQWIDASGGLAAVEASLAPALSFILSVDRCTGGPATIVPGTNGTSDVLRFPNCFLANGEGDALSESDLADQLNFLFRHPVFSFFFDKDYDADSTDGTLTRAVLLFGAPLGNWTGEDFTNYQADPVLRQKQADFFVEWALPFGQELESASDEDMEVLYFNTALIFDVFIEILIRDGSLAGGSFVLVYAYLTFHTRSFFLSTLGMFHVLMSFPVAFFIYRVIFQIQSFYGLNFLSIYIILAIGADDIFVYFDAFAQSKGAAPDWVTTDRKTRHAWVFRRAAKAMAITSSTTFVAFMATAFSPLLTVSVFGIFTALLVLCNYLFVISWFPGVCVLYDRLNCGVCCGSICCAPEDGETTCCYNERNNTDVLHGDVLDQYGGKSEEADYRMALGLLADREAKAAEKAGGSKKGAKKAEGEGEEASLHQLRPLERFFNTTMTDFVTASPVRYVIIALFVVLLAVFIAFAAQLQPNLEDEEFLPEDHPFQRVITLINNDFAETSTDNYVQVEVVWGLDAPYIDRSEVSRYDPILYGDAVLVKDFKPHEVADPMADACEATIDPSKDLTRQLLGDKEHLCPTLSMRQSMNASAWATAISSEADFNAAYETWKVQFEATALADEIAALQRLMGVVEGNWRFMANLHNTTLVDKFVGQPFTITEPFYDEWEAHVEEINEDFPTGNGDAIQVSAEWNRMIVQRTYVTSALSGALTSIAFAFLVLLVSTLNVPIAIITTVSIAGVVAIVLGAMVMLGWALGTIESICATILVGLSVDYNVHIAITYTESKKYSRLDRVRDALTEMGITVLGGAITSALASVILFGTQLQFFFKFGVFMFCTIVSSICFALLLFPALCSVLGPEGTFGSLKPPLSKLIAKCRGH